MHLVYGSHMNTEGGPTAHLLGVCPRTDRLKCCYICGLWRIEETKESTVFKPSERIQGCSACRSGLGSHDKHVALASVIKNTRLVFGSFSARYILEKGK